MTERTINYKEEVEKSETVEVCDHCGLSDDAPEHKGDLVPYTTNRINDEKPDLHYHEKCLSKKMTEYEYTQPRISDFSNQDGRPLFFAFSVGEFLIYSLLIASFGGLVASSIMGEMVLFDLPIIVFMGVFAAGAALFGYMNADIAMDEVLDDG